MINFLDRRQEIRSAPVLRGPAILLVGSESVLISIENVSRSGIRVLMASQVSLPRNVRLKLGDAFLDGEVVWQDGASAGLELR